MMASHVMRLHRTAWYCTPSHVILRSLFPRILSFWFFYPSPSGRTRATQPTALHGSSLIPYCYYNEEPDCCIGTAAYALLLPRHIGILRPAAHGPCTQNGYRSAKRGVVSQSRDLLIRSNTINYHVTAYIKHSSMMCSQTHYSAYLSLVPPLSLLRYHVP
jgi:hypothetical protein